MPDLYTDMLTYYRPHYGEETEALFEAMRAHEEKVALLNPFIDPSKLGEILQGATRENALGPLVLSVTKDCKPQLIDGLLSHYFLDRSSCIAPLLLPLAPGARVLDMCSAPGGKLLFMLSRSINRAFFVANDISKLRLARLRTVLNAYVPKSVQSAVMQLTNRDAIFFGLKEPECYDAILLDAPCSSEAHVLKANKGFKPQKSLPKRQYALLCAALLAVKRSGYIMYATCSINKNENEGVIKRLLSRKKGACALAPFHSPLGKPGDYGVTILPHRDGAGPAFLSLLQKQ